MGSGADDNLGLSHNASSFTMLRMQTKIGKMNFRVWQVRLGVLSEEIHLYGDIASGESYIINGQSRILERQKYLSGHRLEIGLASWIDLGFHEQRFMASGY